MGQKEANRLKNQEKTKTVWLAHQAHIQKLRKSSPYDIYEKDHIWDNALKNGFD